MMAYLNLQLIDLGFTVCAKLVKQYDDKASQSLSNQCSPTREDVIYCPIKFELTNEFNSYQKGHNESTYT
jgi:hypothetical protein